MTVVRELIAKFGIDFDKKGVAEADKGMKKFTGDMTAGLAAVTGLLGVGSLVAFTKEIVTSASDAEESLNLLNESFKDNKQEVLSWASKFADAAGRSKYEMEALAGRMGSLLTPMMDGNTEASARMSTKLSELAVDLGSFYNIADSDVLAALRSGLTGEMEPLKRLGVVMSQDALDAFALSKGIETSVKDMSNAEKTALRYSFIMEKTTIAQGDAERTSGGFANTTKRVKGALSDLATNAGKAVLPFFTDMLGGASKLIEKFKVLLGNTNVVKGAMVGLGAAMLILGVVTAVAFAPALLAFGKLALAVTAVTLVATDLFNLFDGKQSVIGSIIETFAGPGSATEAVTFLKDAFNSLKDVLNTYILPYLQKMLGYWKTVFSILFKIVYGAVKPLIVEWKILAKIIGILFTALGEKLGPVFEDVKNWIMGAASAVRSFLAPALDTVAKYFDKITKAWGVVGNFLETKFPEVFGPDKNIPAPASASAAAPVINQSNNVYVAGAATPQTASTIASESGRAAAKSNKDAVRALTQRAK